MILIEYERDRDRERERGDHKREKIRERQTHRKMTTTRERETDRQTERKTDRMFSASNILAKGLYFEISLFGLHFFHSVSSPISAKEFQHDSS